MATRARKVFVERGGGGANPMGQAAGREAIGPQICDLGLDIVGTDLEDRIQRLYDELAETGLSFRPHCWSLDGVFCRRTACLELRSPFYLAHPACDRLEEAQVLDVEGGRPNRACDCCGTKPLTPSTTRTVAPPCTWRGVFGLWGTP